MKRKLFLFTLAALLMAVAGTQADDDLLWTKNLDPHHITGVFFAYGDSVAVAVAHGGIFQYDANTGELLKSKEITNPQFYAWYSFKIPNKNLILTRNKKLILWDLETNDTIWTIDKFSAFAYPAYKTDAIYYLSSPIENKSLVKIDLMTGKEIERKAVNIPFITYEITMSYDERFMFMNAWSGSGYAKLMYDLENNKMIPLAEATGEPFSVSFSPDGKYVAAGGEKKVRIWNLETMNIEKIIDVVNESNAVKFSRDSKYLYYADNDLFSIFAVSINDWKKIKSYHCFSYGIDVNYDYQLLATNTASIYLFSKFSDISDQILYPVLFPNPTTNLVNIKLEQLTLEPINISIYDERGKLITTIFEGIAEQADFVWSTEAVTSGVYFCKIERRSSISTYKIIVNR